MSYVIPKFNLVARVWTFGSYSLASLPPSNAPRVGSLAVALVYGRRVNVMSTGGTDSQGVPLQEMNLLSAKGSDVRGNEDTVGPDLVECPSGSGRWYTITFVDDIGKGYPNEHRTASILQVPRSWRAPYP